MWIVCYTENSQELSALFYSENKTKLEQVDGAPSHVSMPAPTHISAHIKIPDAFLQAHP